LNNTWSQALLGGSGAQRIDTQPWIVLHALYQHSASMYIYS